MSDHKHNILFIRRGPEYYPDLAHFKDRYKLLSEANYQGSIFTMVNEKKFEKKPYDNFMLYGFVPSAFNLQNKLRYLHFIFKTARRLNKKCPVDCIICADPIFTGVIGAILKFFLKTKLIIEINSENYAGAPGAFYGKNLLINIKTLILKCVAQCSLNAADGIKVLAESNKQNVPKKFYTKSIFSFHDFVPTHIFTPESPTKQDILFIGYPFYLKGLDILIKAFLNITGDHPDAQLTLIGHQLNADASKYFDILPESITILPGMHYDDIRPYFSQCYCLVLPSRTEGMGRVLIEAMACGKPVIGSNVGGIPDVIEDERNGFLFESENTDDLTDKLDRILKNPQLAQNMGKESVKIVEEKFSSTHYIQHFTQMINTILRGTSQSGK